MDLKIQIIKMKKKTQQSSNGIMTSASELMTKTYQKNLSWDTKGKLGSK